MTPVITSQTGSRSFSFAVSS